MNVNYKFNPGEQCFVVNRTEFKITRGTVSKTNIELLKENDEVVPTITYIVIIKNNVIVTVDEADVVETFEEGIEILY